VDHHNNDNVIEALVQPLSNTSKAVVQQWLHSTHTTIQVLVSRHAYNMHAMYLAGMVSSNTLHE